MVITRPAVTALVVCLVGSLGLVAKPVSNGAKQAATKARTATRQKSSKSKVVAYRKPIPRKFAAPASPGSDRIRSVQMALIERGYLQGEATGSWNAASIEALKKFETAQKVRVDGKIDSKMLIALGLGPKYDNGLNGPSGTDTAVAADQLNNNL
jgi:hypothetical protein